LSRQVEQEVRAHFGAQVFRSVIPRNVRLSEAPSHGKPILLYDVHSKGATSYLNLAEEVLLRIGRSDPPREPPALGVAAPPAAAGAGQRGAAQGADTEEEAWADPAPSGPAWERRSPGPRP